MHQQHAPTGGQPLTWMPADWGRQARHFPIRNAEKIASKNLPRQVASRGHSLPKLPQRSETKIDETKLISSYNKPKQANPEWLLEELLFIFLSACLSQTNKQTSNYKLPSTSWQPSTTSRPLSSTATKANHG